MSTAVQIAPEVPASRRVGLTALATLLVLSLTRGPVYRVRFEVAALSGDFIDDHWVQASFVVLYVSTGAVALASGAWVRLRSQRDLMLATTAVGGVLLLSAVWSVDPRRSGEQGAMMLLGSWAMLLVGAALGVKRLLVVVTFAMHIAVALGTIAVFADWRISRDANGTWAGIFFNRNSFAAPAMVGLICLTFVAVDALVHRSRAFSPAVLATPLFGLLAGLDLYVLVKTESLTPWLGVIFATVAVASVVALHQTRPDSSALTGALTALGAVFVLWRILLLLRPHSDIVGLSPNLEGRTLIWGVIRTFVEERRIQGWGFMGVWTRPEIHYAFLNFGGGGYDVNEAHSGYYEVLLGAGWLGALALIWFGFIALTTSARWLRIGSGPARAAPLFVVGYFLGINLTESYIAANILPWSLVVAILAAACPPNRTAVPAGPERSRIPALHGPVLDG